MRSMETRKVRIDTLAIDGLRGFAVFHIILGHLFLYSNFRPEPEPTDRRLAESDVTWSTTACPEGWLRVNDTCYGGSCEVKLRDDAERTCGELVQGGHLFSPRTVQRTWEVVWGLFEPRLDHFQSWIWTGAQADAEGSWRWPNGDALRDGDKSELWQTGEPNDYGGKEDCTATAGIKLYDVPCGGQGQEMMPLRFICEVPAKMDQCGSPCPDGAVGKRKDPCRFSSGYIAGCGTSGGIYLMGGGSMGLFYIISGFVMAVGYCQVMLEAPRGCAYWACFCWPVSKGQDGENYGKLKACDFWIRRLVRLAPMYYLTNIVGIVMRRIFVPDRPTAEPDRWDSYLLTFLGLTSWNLRFPMGNELTWTISTMLFFYLCFPALAPRIQRVHPSNLPKLAWAMYVLQSILMFASFLGLQNYWVRMYPLLRLPIFIMGMSCGLIRVHQQRQMASEMDLDMSPVSVRDRPRQVEEHCCCCALEPWLNPVSIILIWLVMTLTSSVLAFFCNELVILLRGLLEVVYPILFFDWVLALTSPVNQKSYVVRFFKSKVMRFLGDISMCSYMIHMLLAEAVGYTISRTAGDYPWWMVVAIVPSTIVLGWCLTTFYEKPIAQCLRPRGSEGAREAREARAESREREQAEVIGSPVQVRVNPEGNFT